MHPILLPWTIPAEVLTVLAWVLAVAVGGFVFWAVRQRRKDETAGSRWGIPAIAGAGTLALGAWLIQTRLQPIEAGPIPLHTYGLMIALGFIFGIHLGGREAERTGLWTKEQVNDLAFLILIWSMVGARVLFIVVNWSGPGGYGENPGRIFEIWNGGLVFYGGFIGALIASVWWAKKHKLDFRVIGDTLIPSVALGHFFGRMGCIAAGCCWGKVCHDPHFVLGAEYPKGALAYSEMVKDPSWRDHILAAGHTPALHPTQMYEAVGELFIFILLITLVRPYKRFHGAVLSAWLVLYAILRLSIETFRGDFGRGMLLRIPETDPVLLSTSQVIGVAMLVLGVVLWFRWRPKNLAKVEPGPTPEPA